MSVAQLVISKSLTVKQLFCVYNTFLFISLKYLNFQYSVNSSFPSA